MSREEQSECEIDYEGLIKLYFAENEKTENEETEDERSDEEKEELIPAFESVSEEWTAWSRFIDLVCTILLMQKESDQPESFDRIGCLLNDVELSHALEPHSASRFPAWSELREVFLNLVDATLTYEEGEPELPLGSILRLGLLKPVEWIAFLLALCIHKSRKYERVFGVLQEQPPGIIMPTVGFTVDFSRLFLTDEEADPAYLLDPDSFLNRIILSQVSTPDGLSLLSRPLGISRQTYAYATGSETGLGELSYCSEERYCYEEESYICHEDTLEELMSLYVGLIGFEEPGVIFLEGEEGCGRTFLVEQLAAALESNILIISLRSLLSGNNNVSDSFLQEVKRRCFFRKDILYLKDFPEERAKQSEALYIIECLFQDITPLFVGGRKMNRELVPGRLSVHFRKIPIPNMGSQKILWNLFAERENVIFGEDVDVDQIISKYNMQPGQIAETMREVRMYGEIEEDGIHVDKELIERRIRMGCIQNFGEYATKIEPAFTWADLQLLPESRDALIRAMDRIRYKSIVNEKFGFGKKLPYGGGVSIVLYGPPGTGKTMAAQVVARELGLDIYRIDLSQIESKYVGETEKNLGRIFETAKYSNAVLFFDEADALFAKRTAVGGSNDRHANAETAYLLQKIEEYSGVSILATNVFNNFDEAFKRRMTFLINMRWPEEKERLQLWQKIFPSEAPLAEDVDFAYYAKIADMPGSSIKAVALAAAYRAAGENRSISNKDIISAIEDEFRKNDRSIRLAEKESGNISRNFEKNRFY